MDRNELAAWFGRLSNCRDVVPTGVTIQGVEYEACWYVDDAHGPKRRLYVLGELPQCYARRNRTCFRFPGSEDDWYVASYMTAKRYAQCTPSQRAYHPAPSHFLLFKWGVPDGRAIDAHVVKPYGRFEVREIV